MFEQYTEQSRRVIFFARYEASVLGSLAIDTEHLLLGLLREAGGIAGAILERGGLTHAAVQRRLEDRRHPGGPTSTAVDIPLTEDARSVLLHAAREAERMPAPYVGLEHLLLGLLAVRESVAGEILAARGLRLDEVREEVRLRAPVKDSDDGVRVDLALPEEKWVVTFFADGRTTVEVFLPSGVIEDGAALTRLFDKLGPEQGG
jgi:ATP-dependent Clp protease ATP-binding subunit ClpC